MNKYPNVLHVWLSVFCGVDICSFPFGFLLDLFATAPFLALLHQILLVLWLLSFLIHDLIGVRCDYLSVAYLLKPFYITDPVVPH